MGSGSPWLKSDDFKKLKKEKEELYPQTFNSDAVKGVQSFLNEEGYTDKSGEKLFVDGRYGAKTANAVMDYQRENGLSVDGIVGDETWDSIYRKKKKKENESYFKEAIKNNRKTENYESINLPKFSTHKPGKDMEREILEITRNAVWGIPTYTHNKTGDIPEKAEREFDVFADDRTSEKFALNTEEKKTMDKPVNNTHEEISEFDIQAAAMAEHVYSYDKNSPLGKRLTDGWYMEDSHEGTEGLKVGIYVKRSEWGIEPTEYVLVFEGSTWNWDDWKNNAEQAFGPNSVDMQEAIEYANEFVKKHDGQKVTFVGHSKGGAEAIAAATATNCDAVVFNPAWANLEDYGLSAECYKGNIKSYIVENEILHDVQGKVNEHIDVTYLPDQNKYAYWARYFPKTGIIGATVAIFGGVENHKMKAVNKAIQEQE